MPPASFEAAPANATAAAAISGAIALVAMMSLRRARGTTLAAPAAWAIVAAAVFAAVEAMLAVRGEWEGTLGASLMRYAAATGSCCPIMAVLGAKRPQDRGWQWVVLSLWIVLLVPAGQAWAAGAGEGFEPALIWQALITFLIAIVLMNYGPTRHVAAATVFIAGQLGLLAPYLMRDHVSAVDATAFRLGGLVFILLAAAGALWPAFTQRFQGVPRTAPNSLARFQQRWLSFRDAWGAFWGLRVLHRINESAELSGWPVRLQWTGFVAADEAAPAEIDDRVAGQIEQTMDSLLRRFERAEQEF
jgi:hypothetical protein